MNKKTIFISSVIFIILVAALTYQIFRSKKDDHGCLVNQGYSWCDFKRECVQSNKDNCVLTKDWVLDGAKKIIGLDLNTMPVEITKIDAQGNKVVFSGTGIYYLDTLNADKITKGFSSLEQFFNDIGLKVDPDNDPIRSDEKDELKYTKEDVICSLSRINNTNNTSSLALSCGNTADILYGFDSLYGKKCSVDNDCDLVVNGCARRQVCRSRGVKFYNDCENPSSIVAGLDTSIAECVCFENQCVPKNENLRSKN